MLEADKPKRSYRRWYAIIRDENDGEMRVIRRVDTKDYDGLNSKDDDRVGEVYLGHWVKVQESQDMDVLRAMCRLVAKEIPDWETVPRYYSYKPSE